MQLHDHIDNSAQSSHDASTEKEAEIPADIRDDVTQAKFPDVLNDLQGEKSNILIKKLSVSILRTS